MSITELDDITKARIADEQAEIAPLAADVRDAIEDFVGDINRSNAGAIADRLRALGVREDATNDGRFARISTILGIVVGGMSLVMTKDQISQVLRYTWANDSYFGRVSLFPESVPDVVRDQFIRMLRFCLDELAFMVHPNGDVPMMTWFLIETTLDIYSQAKALSGDDDTSPHAG